MIRLVAALLMLPGGALACACCAERGERFAYEVQMGRYEQGELARLSAEGSARLFVTDCGFDCVRGISAPQDEYDVALTVNEAGLRFGFADQGGRARGALQMNWPERYVFSGVDTEPMAQSPDARLYSELRLAGEVTGSGDFAGGAPLEATLIFAGRGNMCFQAAGLTHWVLDVSGEGAGYRLFGALRAR